MSRNDLAATHIPLLIRAMEHTYGPVLELGMGYNSTPLLTMMCRDMGRKLVSLEGDKVWADKFSDYASDTHEIRVVTDWDQETVIDGTWGLVFVDHRPATRRAVEAMRVRDRAGIVLIHDSEPEIDRFYRYSKLYPHFKYRFDYTTLKPNTTALSNYIDVSKELK